MGLNGVAAPQLFGWSFGVNATPYYYVGVALVAFLILTSQRLKILAHRPRLDGDPRGRDRRRRDGRQPGPLQAPRFCHRRRLCRRDRHLFVAKLQTATPEMFMFPVSVMILVMVVFGGIGSVWGVVVGALILQILQSWFLEDLSQWLHALGRLVDVDWLQQVELASSIELIFGLILVMMMLYRREGLIPATRPVPALSLDEQTAQVGARRLRPASSRWRRRSAIAAGEPLLEINDLTVRFGGLVALRSVALDGAGAFGGRGDRAERLGQIDPVQRRDRAGLGRSRRRSALPAKRSPGCRRMSCSSAASPARFRTSGCSRT